MATQEQIYDLKTYVESAALAILQASCSIDNVYTGRDEESVVTPNVQVIFTQTPVPFHAYFSASTVINDAWGGSLSLVIQSDRAINDVSHSVYVSRALNYLQDYREWNNALPYHICCICQLGSMQTNTMEENGTDLSAINIGMSGFVNPSAW